MLLEYPHFALHSLILLLVSSFAVLMSDMSATVIGLSCLAICFCPVFSTDHYYPETLTGEFSAEHLQQLESGITHAESN